MPKFNDPHAIVQDGAAPSEAEIFIRLSDLPGALRLHGAKITYRAALSGALDGSIPAHRKGARWFIARADFPAIIAALSPKSPARAA